MVLYLIYGILEVQLLSQFGDNIFFCWYKSTSIRADSAAADVATQCLYRLIVWGWAHMRSPSALCQIMSLWWYDPIFECP